MFIPAFTNEKGDSDKLKYRRHSHFEKRISVFKSEIPVEAIKKISEKDVAIIVNRITATWYKLFFNDIMIGHAGNLMNNRANVWNQVNYFVINPDLIKNNNRLRIEICFDYAMGGPENPIIITNVGKASEIKSWFDFILWYTILIAQGCLGLAFILSILCSFVRPVKETGEYLLFSGGMFLIAIYLIEYLPFNTFFIPVFTLWKITETCLFIAVVLINLSLYHHFKNRLNLIMSGMIILAVILLHFFFSDNMLTFFDTCHRIFILIIINFAVWGFVGLINFRKTYYAKGLLASSILVLLCTVFEIYHILALKRAVMQFSVIGVIVFCLNQTFLMTIEFIRTIEGRTRAVEKAQSFYNKSIRDSMTGLYNNEYILKKLASLRHNYSYIIIDIDDFKSINDTYGHQAGDRVICHVADVITGSVRKDDLAGRYGGDEFCLILSECSLEKAREIAEELIADVSQYNDINPNNDFSISLSIGIAHKNEAVPDFNNVIKAADVALYKIKSMGKGGVLCEEK